MHNLTLIDWIKARAGLRQTSPSASRRSSSPPLFATRQGTF
jgi:hypothetical protein